MILYFYMNKVRNSNDKKFSFYILKHFWRIKTSLIKSSTQTGEHHTSNKNISLHIMYPSLSTCINTIYLHTKNFNFSSLPHYHTIRTPGTIPFTPNSLNNK